MGGTSFFNEIRRGGEGREFLSTRDSKSVKFCGRDRFRLSTFTPIHDAPNIAFPENHRSTGFELDSAPRGSSDQLTGRVFLFLSVERTFAVLASQERFIRMPKSGPALLSLGINVNRRYAHKGRREYQSYANGSKDGGSALVFSVIPATTTKTTTTTRSSKRKAEETRNMEFRVEGEGGGGDSSGSIPFEITRESVSILRNTRED